MSKQSEAVTHKAAETTEAGAGSESELRDLLAGMPLSIDDAVERAAQHLPVGWSVNIRIEHEGYGVGLTRPNGSTVDDIDGGDGIRSDINEAICIANGFDI